jgi:hypothetical protein
MRIVSVALAFVVAIPAVAAAQVAPIKTRTAVLVDSSGSMLMTPEIITFPETCAANAFNGCTASGNPSAAQETCNACVADTIHFRSGCSTSWDATCRSLYAQCITALTGSTTCTQALNVTDGISTRGDGSAETPGCDLNGDGKPNDSRMFQAKAALANVVATFGEVEFSLWRYAQEDGGQTCSTAADCPKSPGGLTVFSCDTIAGVKRCNLNATILDVSTTTVGQCNPFTWNGSDATFSCANCDFNNSYERAVCESRSHDRTRTGGLSLLNGTSTVNCALPSTSHPNLKSAGAFDNNGACDPNGGQRLVDFPATGFDDNYDQIIAWIDGVQTNFATDVELKPQGGTPIAASLRDMRTSLNTTIGADSKAACRKYQAIVLTDGGESCETVSNAKTAAQALFQNATKSIPVYVIGFAICPNGQTNCQTAQDLNGIASSGGTTSAYFAKNQLELQAALADIVSKSVVKETCNGADDDCDGAVDEDFPGKGNACTVGVGQCKRTGTLVCVSSDTLGCNVSPGSPSPEVCNGLDDDCNGLIDDGISCQTCVPSCAQNAGCDVCNGRDDDCDGKTDENFTSTTCGTNIGTCTFGNTTCTAGVVACQGGQGPTTEVCDNKDNDCDTIVDGMTQGCYPANTVGCDVNGQNCVGICKGGAKTCTAGAFGTCSGATTPITEIACNGLDDDCDGLVDEGKGPEQCDGIDNDCNGKIDDGVAQTDPDIGKSCGTGPFVGVCAPGTIQCIGGAEQCVGEIKPSAEQCNNKDDNCNGQTDDNVPGYGGACGSSVGECKPGTLQCQAGQAVCTGSTGPSAEICDGKDNNCNGLTDETDPNLGMTCNTLPNGTIVPTETGECKFGVLACQAGALGCVGTIGPVAEKCNILDDDCDGKTDEDFPQLGMSCDNGQQGICKQAGVYVCAPNGQGVVCTAPAGTPGTETCNGIDDDCDGQTDELPMPVVGTVCAPANGMCQPGLWECQAGALVCGAPSNGQTEICNLKDDDCDGLVDEEPLPGEGNNCTDPGFETIGDTGECEFGKTVCKNGAIGCDGYKGPTDEICDGKDNDCDGIVDESATCPQGNVCNGGECVGPCMTGEFPCGAGYVCKHLDQAQPPGDYCVKDPCNGVTCPGQEICDHNTGVCKDLCEGITCPTGAVCRQGFCLDCFHLPELCTPDQICVRDANDVGQCQDNPCDPNPCQAGQTCSNGVCSDACAGGCPDGSVCVDGACTTDACSMVHCFNGQVCDPSDGKCVDPKCEGISCNPGEVCVQTTGTCEPNPCTQTVCPTNQFCAVDPDGRAVCGDMPGEKHDRVTAAGGGCNAGGGDNLWIMGLFVLPFLRRRRATGGGAS